MKKSSFCPANNCLSSLKAHLCVVYRNTCHGTEAGDKVGIAVLGLQGGNACIGRVQWQYIKCGEVAMPALGGWGGNT